MPPTPPRSPSPPPREAPERGEKAVALRGKKRPLQVPDDYEVVSEVETFPSEEEEAMEKEGLGEMNGKGGGGKKRGKRKVGIWESV